MAKNPTEDNLVRRQVNTYLPIPMYEALLEVVERSGSMRQQDVVQAALYGLFRALGDQVEDPKILDERLTPLLLACRNWCREGAPLPLKQGSILEQEDIQKVNKMLGTVTNEAPVPAPKENAPKKRSRRTGLK